MISIASLDAPIQRAPETVESVHIYHVTSINELLLALELECPVSHRIRLIREVLVHN